MTLERLRINAALTQKQLAALVHVTPVTVFNWENGITEPRITNIRPLADALGVSISDIHAAIDETRQGSRR